MLDEEVVNKEARHGNERLLIVNAVSMFAIPAVFFGGASDFITGLFIALGILAPINVFVYSRSWLDASPHTWLRFLLALSPYIITLGLTIAGLGHPALENIQIGSREYLNLINDCGSSIISAAPGIVSALTPDLITIGCVACGLSIYFITESRNIVRRIIFYCALIAASIAAVGLIYESILSVMGFENMPSFGEGGFFTYPFASWWAALAILWMGGALTVAVYSAQRFRLSTFFYSLRFLSLLAALVLFLSVLYCGTPAERALAAALAAFACSVLFIDTVPTGKNLSRHWTSKYSRRRKNNFMSTAVIPCAMYLVAALISAAACVSTFIESVNDGDEMLIVNSDSRSCATLAERQALIADSIDIIELKPAFGWGTGSFPNVFAFYQSSDLGDCAWDSPHSEPVKKLVENGLVGLVLSVITPLAFFILWISRFDFSASGMVLFFTLACFSVLTVIDCPFQCIAVQASFWILMMSLFKWDCAKIR